MVTYDVFIDAAHAAIPSNTYYEDIGDTYTALADGYVYFLGTVNSDSTARVSVEIGSRYSITYTPQNVKNTFIGEWQVIGKGETVTFNIVDVTRTLVRFYYCNGSAPVTSNP